MPFKIGDKYFTASEEGGLVQTTSEKDILGRLGTGGSLEASRRAGDLIDVDPSQIRFERRSEIDKYALGGDPGYNIFGPTGNLGRIQNLAQAQALGITPPSALPQGQIEQNQAFNQYLQQTGQTFQGGQFSGSLSVPNPNIQPGAVSGLPGAQYDATIGRGGQAPFQVGGQFGQRTFGRVGNQVFETTNGQRRPITEREFNEQLKAQGLNLEVLPQLGPAPTLGQQEAEKNLGAGVVSTSQYQGEQADFFKKIQDRFAKVDEITSQMLSSLERSQEERSLKKTINDITSSFEAGLTDIQGQTIPMQLIVGQGAELEKRANDRLKALNRTLETLQGDREAQYNILSKTYDISRNSINDTIALYKMTQPDKIAFDSDTGQVILYNPFTQQVSSVQAPGFKGNDKFVKDLMAKYPDANISPTDTYAQAAAKLQNSKIYQQQTRLADGSGEEQKKLEEERKRDMEFNKSLSAWNLEGTREQFIRQLRGAYPEYNPDQISAAVYKIYPDGYNNQ